jgi:predicted transcriptional regulator
VSLTVHLPEDLSRRVEEAAARRHQTPEEVALEAIAAQLPAGPVEDSLEAFIGSGRSGRGDLARSHREVLAESVADKTARDV